MQAAALGCDLQEEADRANERRVLVLTGTAERGHETADAVLDELPIGIGNTLAISDRADWICERVDPTRSSAVMGRTLDVVVLDLHGGTIPNAVGRATGAVNGGGLLVILCPRLADWPTTRDAFDEGLVVAPFAIEDVRGGFKRHLVDTLRTHPGIGIVDVDSDTIERSGLTDPPPYRESEPATVPRGDHRFPEEAYEHCRTRDQARVLRAFERLSGSDAAVVVSAERGRGKSSVAGIAAAALAASGSHVGITAPEVDHVRSAFACATKVADALGGVDDHNGGPHPGVRLTTGGRVAFHDATSVPRALESGEIDVLFVDEAAGIPVPLLESYLSGDRLGLTTTRFGYEGSGQGFAQRFRMALGNSDLDVTDREMRTPIRYAASDPIEAWLNRALYLDAHPAVDSQVADTDPTAVTYRRWDPEVLAERESVLRQSIGLLATAHYRTEPDDLARILDAPNLELATLRADGAVVSVVLLAREGNISGETAMGAVRGDRLRGNMLPDVFINAVGDTTPAERSGLRIVRIATHQAVRRRGLASQLLAAVRADLGDDVAWIGTGFGVTADLLAFWHTNAFVPIFLGTSKNRASGVQSVVMLDGTSSDLARRYGALLPRRLRGSLSDVHRELDPTVVRELLRTAPERASLELTERDWRGLVAAAWGPGRYDLHPEPARRLVVHQLSGPDPDELNDRERTLVIRKILQGRSWERVTRELDYPSIGQARRATGEALALLLDRHGNDAVRDERRRLGTE